MLLLIKTVNFFLTLVALLDKRARLNYKKTFFWKSQVNMSPNQWKHTNLIKVSQDDVIS